MQHQCKSKELICLAWPKSNLLLQASPTECHSWQGKEQWVTYQQFADALHGDPLDSLLNCDSWQVSRLHAMHCCEHGRAPLYSGLTRLLWHKNQPSGFRPRALMTKLCISTVEQVLVRAARKPYVCCVQPGELVFPSKRGENRAVQVVRVHATSRQQPLVMRAYTFSFCPGARRCGAIQGGRMPLLSPPLCHACEACNSDARSLRGQHGTNLARGGMPACTVLCS